MGLKLRWSILVIRMPLTHQILKVFSSREHDWSQRCQGITSWKILHGLQVKGHHHTLEMYCGVPSYGQMQLDWGLTASDNRDDLQYCPPSAPPCLTGNNTCNAVQATQEKAAHVPLRTDQWCSNMIHQIGICPASGLFKWIRYRPLCQQSTINTVSLPS